MPARALVILLAMDQLRNLFSGPKPSAYLSATGWPLYVTITAKVPLYGRLPVNTLSRKVFSLSTSIPDGIVSAIKSPAGGNSILFVTPYRPLAYGLDLSPQCYNHLQDTTSLRNKQPRTYAMKAALNYLIIVVNLILYILNKGEIQVCCFE